MSVNTHGEGWEPGGRLVEQDRTPRQRLLVAAREAFEENGFVGTRVMDITARADLPRWSFYRYFASKDDAICAVVEKMISVFSLLLDNAIFAPDLRATPAERIFDGNQRFFRIYQEHARILGQIEQISPINERVSAIRRRQRESDLTRVAESIRGLQRRGLADQQIDADIALCALSSMVEGYADSWLVRGDISCPFEEAVEQITKLFVNGFGLA